jgi:hypothetical protein
MTYDPASYELAVRRLNHIGHIKRNICGLLDRLTDVSESTMLVGAAEYDRAVRAIWEAIDEMFYEQAYAAREIKETFERTDWRNYQDEQRTN